MLTEKDKEILKNLHFKQLKDKGDIIKMSLSHLKDAEEIARKEFGSFIYDKLFVYWIQEVLSRNTLYDINVEKKEIKGKKKPLLQVKNPGHWSLIDDIREYVLERTSVSEMEMLNYLNGLGCSITYNVIQGMGMVYHLDTPHGKIHLKTEDG